VETPNIQGPTFIDRAKGIMGIPLSRYGGFSKYFSTWAPVSGVIQSSVNSERWKTKLFPLSNRGNPKPTAE
jgi:hypothetical protein